MSPTEVAWAAGLFEGEGCWHLQEGRYAGASLNTTDPDVLDRFADLVRFDTVRPHTWQAEPHHKPQYRWSAYGFEQIQALVAMFWLWLGERRRARAVEVLTAAKATTPRSSAVCRNGHQRVNGVCVACRRRSWKTYRDSHMKERHRANAAYRAEKRGD